MDMGTCRDMCTDMSTDTCRCGAQLKRRPLPTGLLKVNGVSYTSDCGLGPDKQPLTPKLNYARVYTNIFINMFVVVHQDQDLRG